LPFYPKIVSVFPLCYIHSALKDLLSASSIAQALETRVIGRRIIYRPVVLSTMAVAREEALAGSIEGTVVVAGRQTLG
jgi:hypothetical protein